MSDIFEQNQWRNDIFSVDPRKAAETAEKENRRKAEFQTYLNRQAEKYLGLRDLKNYKYYAPLTDEDILVLEAAQETGVLSEDEVYKQATSIGIARKYGIDSGYVRQNLEAFLAAEDIDTAGKIPRSWFNGFVSRARIGANSMLTGIFGNELLKEESKGITETSAALREYLRALKTENESLQFGDESLSQNPVLKFLQKEVVGGALESLPYTAYIMGAAAIGTLMAGSWGGRAGSLSAGLQVVSGQEYFNLTELKDSEGNQLIDNDIARNTSLLVGTIGSFIETLLWDSFAHFGKAVGRSTGREVADSLTQRLTAKVLTNLHGKGFLYRIAKQGLEGLFRLLGEGGEEFFQQIAEEVGQNVALEVQRERVFEKMGAAPEERDRLIRLLEGAKTSKDEIFHNAFEALKGGASASLFTGLPETILNYRADSASIRNLKTTAETAQSFEEYKEANTGNAALGDLSPEVREDVLKKIYSDEKEKQQQEAVQADSLAEVTDYRNAREIPEAADEETGVVTMRLADVDTSNIYRGDGGRLETAEYQDAREDGAVEGRFVAGDPRIEDKGNAENRYGYINYTEKENTVTIDEFKMSYGYESLREDLYRQFAERHAEQDILWNPQGSAGLSIREQLVQANPQGPKNGLNWFETPARGEPSAEARRVAQRFQPYMGTRATPLETALAVEAFGAFYRRRGESLEGAMERLFGRVTNEATDEITAAQRQGKTVKGATWVEKTAEGMRRVIYVSKNAADASTVAHEISHAAADDFTEGERNIAARALNGYRLKDGTAVEFRENSGPWDERQQEAFAEALENYLANGNAPTPELKRLFERIKDFMKRIYRAMTGWTELSPQAEEFYRSLFSGELVDRGRAEEASGTGREASGTARNDNSGNDTAGVGGGPSEEEAVRQRQRDTVLADPEVPLEDKAPLVFDAAREALFQIRDSREGDPVEALIGRAALIEDPELRGRVTQNIRRLQDIYAGTEAEYKAPNGKPSLLLEALGENRGKQAWYAVRTDSFKEWFGDWEASQELDISEREVSAEQAIDHMKTLTGKDLINIATGIPARINSTQRNKIISLTAVEKSQRNGFTARQHNSAATIIDKLWKHAEQVESSPDKDNDKNIVSIKRFAAPIIFSNETGIAYITAKETIEHGHRIYSLELQEIKKPWNKGGTPDGDTTSKVSNEIISKLLKKVNPSEISLVRDANGEPLPVNPGSQTIFGIFDSENDSPILFQIGDRDLVEEAAGFDSAAEWREYAEAMDEEPSETFFMSEEEKTAWYEAFWQNARKADDSENQSTAQTQTFGSPEEADEEFLRLIGEPDNLEDFTERAAALYAEDYGQWQARDEEEGALRDAEAALSDEVRRLMTHPTWKTALLAEGKMGETQRKRILTMIKNSPREYRALYSRLMNREDLAVRKEDTLAETLKGRIKDSRRENVDSLSPEKLRQLAAELDLEEFAEKVRSGRATYADPVEERYIKSLEEGLEEARKALKELEESRNEDNEFLEKNVAGEIIKAHERILKAREVLGTANKALDKAIAGNTRDVGQVARRAGKIRASYNSLIRDFEVLAEEHGLELKVHETLTAKPLKEALASARRESRIAVKLAKKAARAELKARIEELNRKREAAKEFTKAKKGVIKRIFRPANPREVNAEQGFIIAAIQRFAEPSMLEGLDRFIGGIEKPYLRAIFERWKTDEILRTGILKGKGEPTRRKIGEILSRDKFEKLSAQDKKYLYQKIPPNDWAEALGLEAVIRRREENFPGLGGERALNAVMENLPPHIYYLIKDKPFSAWTLQEGEEFAKVIDNLAESGREIRRAHLDAENRRIRGLQEDILDTVKTVARKNLQDSPGDTPEERKRKAEKRDALTERYAEGAGGTAQAAAKRRKNKAPWYSDMNAYRFARMLDEGRTDGKNLALMFRRKAEAYNQEQAAIDARTEKIIRRRKDLKISETELWDKAIEVDLGKDLGKTVYTVSEVMGILSASRDEYSLAALIYGNLLSESERGEYQLDGITDAELTGLEALAGERYAALKQAVDDFMAREGNGKYSKLMEAIDADFYSSGERVSEALLKYNNQYMPMVEHYFPMFRETAVNSRSADTQLARDLMGASSGAFNLFVEKGFTKGRVRIPPQYQTPIRLDIMGVWAESVKREEHFIAYGQLVKDLNGVYKGSRRVQDAIRRRYGESAVDYINKYINLLANPDSERTASAMDKYIRAMRGNAAAAYLGWKTSSIVKQFITSPWPFLAHMNPLEYWGTFIEFAAHPVKMWEEISELSLFMKHRSANMLVDIVKQNARNTFDRKAGALDKFNERGMKGLEMVDRLCVAPGWLALYRKEYNRLSNDKTNTMSDEDMRKTAALKADEITMLVQPSANPEDLAPLFRGNSELGKAFLQFTSSLNVIWQNIYYDVPYYIAEKRFWNYAGTIIGYGVAGILLGAITVGFDEEDDEKTRALKLAWWATTQFTDAFPIIGSEATGLAELAITGKAQRITGTNILPTLAKAYNSAAAGIKGIREKDFNLLIKAAALAAEAGAIKHGLPVSGFKELLRAAGLEDAGGEAEFHPEAFIGRRGY